MAAVNNPSDKIPSNAQAAWPVGRRIGAVRVLEALSADALGITYRALREGTGEALTLREYFPLAWARRSEAGVQAAPGQQATYQDGLNRFIAAVREAQGFAHPAFPPIEGLWCVHGSAYVATPWVATANLADTLRSGQAVPATLLLRWLRDWARALAPLHEQRLGHGGLHPQALQLKTARSMQLPALFLPPAHAGDAAAVPYLAPEQALAAIGTDAAEPVITPAMDVYALCAMMWQAMVGRPPVAALARRQGVNLPAAAQAATRAYPASLLQAVNAGLALDPAQRPATVQALLAAIGLRPGALPVRSFGLRLRHVRPQRLAPVAANAAIAAIAAASATAAPVTSPATAAPAQAAPAVRQTEFDFANSLTTSLRQVAQHARDDHSHPAAAMAALPVTAAPALPLAVSPSAAAETPPAQEAPWTVDVPRSTASQPSLAAQWADQLTGQAAQAAEVAAAASFKLGRQWQERGGVWALQIARTARLALNKGRHDGLALARGVVVKAALMAGAGRTRIRLALAGLTGWVSAWPGRADPAGQAGESGKSGSSLPRAGLTSAVAACVAVLGLLVFLGWSADTTAPPAVAAAPAPIRVPAPLPAAQPTPPRPTATATATAPAPATTSPASLDALPATAAGPKLAAAESTAPSAPSAPPLAAIRSDKLALATRTALPTSTPAAGRIVKRANPTMAKASPDCAEQLLRLSLGQPVKKGDARSSKSACR